MKRVAPLLFRKSQALFLSAGKLSRYEQEAFEAQRLFRESPTYPGPIRAATPGDTRFYMGSAETILHENERHYWRPVVDDPSVEYLIPLRIRFKANIWVTSGWETRVNVVSIMIPRDATIQEVIEQVIVENQSPYLCNSAFSLSVDGMELDPNKRLTEYNINEMSQIDAVEENDHLLHTDEFRLKDWNVDEMTSEDSNKSPYKEMNMQPTPNLVPRYEGKPKGFFGKNDYSGMKQTS